MTGQTQSRWLSDLPEVRFGVAVAAVAALVSVCVRVGVDATVALALLAGVVAAAGAVLPRRFAAALALSAWAFLTGFVVHAGGRLTLHEADLQRMGVLVLVAILVTSVPALTRRARAAVAHGRARPVGAPHA